VYTYTSALTNFHNKLPTRKFNLKLKTVPTSCDVQRSFSKFKKTAFTYFGKIL
jgi:hypothetical protein